MSNSSNLVLPYLAQGQAQKHVTVNEAIRKLDAIVQLSVISATTTAQPGSPTDGAVYIVPSGKSGTQWASFTDWSLGYYRDGAWEQITPREGWLAYVKDTDLLLFYTGSAWSLFAPGKLLTVSATDRILGRISSGAGAAEEIAFTDEAQQLADDTSFAAMCRTLGTWRIVAASGVAAPHTGDTSETALATIVVPGGSMGPNGVLRITGVFSHTNSANTKTVRFRLGGPSGTAVMAVAVTTTATLMTQRLVQNRNSQSSQLSGNATMLNAFGGNTAAITTSALDMSADQNLVISGQLANAGETVTLESYIVEAAYVA